MINEELKSCPFCGGKEVKVLEDKNHVYSRRSSFKVKCFYCGARTVACTRTYQAIESWNKRV